MIAYVLFCRCGDPAVYTVARYDQLLYDARVAGEDLAAIVRIELRNDRLIAQQMDLESLEATRA